MSHNTFKHAACAGAALGALMFASHAAAQQRSFDIPQQDATKAIPQFVRQSGLQVVASGAELRNVTTNPVQGELDARQALVKMLAGTNLVIGGQSGNIITLRHAPGAQAAESAGNAAVAAVQPVESDLEEVVVTGSRIRRSETTTSAPVTVIDSAAIAERGFISVAQALNQITSVRPQVPQTPGDGSSSGTGQQFANLFGLGAGRTLTLVNGRRMVTSSSGLGDRVVDSNVIPTGLIQRVDVVQAGGAAVYGSDAIAGVINYVLKDNFEGIEFDAQYGITSRKDYPQYAYRVTAGKNFADGRGNIAVDVEYSKTRPLYNSDREEWTYPRTPVANPANTSLTDGQPPQILLNGRRRFWAFNYNGVIFSQNPATGYTAPAAAFLVRPVGAAQNQGFQVAPDGQTLIGYNAGEGALPGSFPTVPFAAGGDGLDFNELAALYSGVERKNISLVGHYDVTPKIKASGEFVYAQTQGYEPIGASGTASNWVLNAVDSGRAAIGFNRNNPFLTPAMIATLDATTVTGPPTAQFRNGGTFFLSKQWADLTPTRATVTTTDTWRGLAALSGDFDVGERNLYWELSYSRAQTKGVSLNYNIDNAKFARAINAVRNAAGQIVCAVNADAIITNDDPACAPLNPFGQGASSQAARAYVAVANDNRYVNNQDDLLATLGGDIVELPGGKAAFSVAYERRAEDAAFTPSRASQLGLFGPGVPTLPSGGKFHTDEFSGEVLVPILGGDFSLPFAKALEFTGQYRKVDNSIAGKENVWGMGLRWDTGYGLTFRASKSRNFRAPTLNQLFEPTRIALGPLGGNDPCDPRSVNSGVTPAVRMANCMAIFTANAGYGLPELNTENARRAGLGQAPLANTAQNRMTFFQSQSQNFSLARITAGGNPTLRNEVSTTETVGFVFQPTFVPGLTLVADRVSVDLRDGLSAFNSANFLTTCVDSTTMPTDICSVVTRDATGQVITGRNTTFNAGKVRFRGEVYNVNYQFPIGRFFNDADLGSLELAAEATHTTRLETSVTGLDLSRADGTTATPDWVARFDVRYAKGPVRFIYTMNYLPSVTPLNSTIETTQFPTTKENIRHNVALTYNIGAYSIRGGINNLTDQGPSFNTTSYGDILGRQYFIGLRGRF